MAGGAQQKQNQQINPQLAAILAQTAGPAGGPNAMQALQRGGLGGPGSQYLPLAAQMMGQNGAPQPPQMAQRPPPQMAPPPGIGPPQGPGAQPMQGQLTPAMINQILARQSGLLGGGQQQY